MGKVTLRDSHTNANGCSLIEYQFESFDDFLAFENYKQESLIDSLKGLTLMGTEDFDEEPGLDSAVVDINIKKKPKKGDLH